MNSKKHDPYYQVQSILSRRDHSEAEVRQKMKRKKFSDEDINMAVDWLYEQKLLNDNLYADRYIEAILLGKPVGPKWLQAKLKQRGVDTSIIERAITDAYGQHKEDELAQEAAATWLRLHRDSDNQRDKLFRFLLSRGFSFESVKKAVE